MATVIHLRCHHCGEPLRDREQEYCPDCNLYLAYRAMPFLLGMILTGHLATDLAGRYPQGMSAVEDEGRGYDDDTALNWE